MDGHTDYEGGFVSGQQGDQQERKNIQGILPVTVRQILHAEKPSGDDVFHIDNVEVGLVKVVGQIFGSQQTQAFFTFKLEDGTGSIEGRMWTDQDSTVPSNTHEFVDGSYVVVIASIKSFNEKVNLTCRKVRLVKDFNEVTYHNTEALYARLTKIGRAHV